MSQINVRNLSNENDDGAPDIVGVSTFSATSYFVPPVGNTAQRPENPQPGDLRFNTDTASLEYFRWDVLGWEQIEMTSPDLGGISEGVFVDSSSYGRTVTTVGGVYQSTTQKKVGTSSIYREGAYSCIHVPDSSDFDWGTNDWTLECWIRRNAVDGDEWLMAHSDGTGANTSIGLHIWSGSVANPNRPSIRFRQSSSNVDCNGTTQLAANTWYHIAGVRDGNTLRIYVNGVQEGTTSISGSPDTSSAPFTMTALRSIGQEGMAGYFDEIRISKSCRYTSGTTFTPSTTPFTSDSNTLILIHSDLGIESGAGVGPRGFLMGGYESYPSVVNKIDYITIPTLGNTTDFGDMYTATGSGSVSSSRTRGVHYGGQVPTTTNSIEYITISSTGNGANFGDITALTSSQQSGSDQTRGIIAGGKTQPSNNYVDTIEYITMASTGNANDFGNLTVAKSHGGSANSSTRMVHVSGQINPSGYSNVIDYITIASTGNATDFGDTVNSGAYGWSMGVVGSSIRGLFALGANDSDHYNSIEYITMATTGNAADFGDLSETEVYKSGMCSPTRGVFAGGSDPSVSNVIDYVTIQSTGNSTDFGDISSTRAQAPGGSNAHGGL